jgi:hypothetical protein
MKTIQRIGSGYVLRGASGTVGARSIRIIAASDEPVRGDPLILDMKRWTFPRSGQCPFVNNHGDMRHGVKATLGCCNDFEVRTMTLNSGRTGKALLATATFAEPEISEDAEIALQFYRRGYLDGFSASFIPHWDGAPSSVTPASQELCEISAVVVPSDINATVLARAVRRQLAGKEMTREDRVAIAQALAERRRDYTYEDRDARAARAREIAGGDDAAIDEIRKRLLLS